MIRTTFRTAILVALATGPALAQGPAAPPPAQMPGMPGMQHNGMAMPPTMPMPGVAKVSPSVPETTPRSVNDAEMMRQMEVMNRAMMTAPMTGDPDQDLVAMMMPHHQGAIDMAKAELTHGKDAFTRKLATDIIAAQEKEIAEMLDWLKKQSK